VKYPFTGGPADGQKIEVPSDVVSTAVFSGDGTAIYQKNYRVFRGHRAVYFAFSHFEKEKNS
jgi:hypothetical protein